MHACGPGSGLKQGRARCPRDKPTTVFAERFSCACSIALQWERSGISELQPGGVGHFFSRSGAADAGTTMPCDRQAEGQADAASHGQEKSIVEKLPRETSKKNIHI
jgi:hypothetical protein